MVAEDPNTRKLISSIGGNARWAKETDPSGATAAARKAADDRFHRQVDPDGKLDPETRARMASHARREHMARMALASVQARRKRAEARKLLAEAGDE